MFRKLFNRSSYDLLRCPQRLPKCYEMTDQEREAAIVRLNRNVWNDPALTEQDQYQKENENADT